MLKKEGYTYEKNVPQKPWGCRERERERESYSLVKINLNLIPIITLYNYII